MPEAPAGLTRGREGGILRATMNIRRAWIPFALMALGMALRFAPGPGTPAGQMEFLSLPLEIDRRYRSMEGPAELRKVRLEPKAPSELLWVTGMRTRIVGPDGRSPRSPEFMCHVNVDYDPAAHAKLFDTARKGSARLFTLSQGQLEMEFPRGYGIPIRSDEWLSIYAQVLNHNAVGKPFSVRHRLLVDFVRDRDLLMPYKPLYPSSAFGMALLEGEHGFFGMKSAPPGSLQSCHPGAIAPNAPPGSDYVDRYGRKFTGHWVVKPGREERRTLVTKIMSLPYDTTIHYIAVHLHPFAESLELRDLTTQKSLFKSRARAPRTGVGLEHVDSFSSAAGIPVYRGRHYEIVSVYNNTTPADQDSMAVMYLYLLDKDFQPPRT